MVSEPLTDCNGEPLGYAAMRTVADYHLLAASSCGAGFLRHLALQYVLTWCAVQEKQSKAVSKKKGNEKSKQKKELRKQVMDQHEQWCRRVRSAVIRCAVANQTPTHPTRNAVSQQRFLFT